MKKFLIIFCLTFGTSFIFANEFNLTFIDIYSGASFDRDLEGAESALLIGLGREIEDSKGTYLSILDLGLWGDNFTIGYHYGRKVKKHTATFGAGVGLGVLGDSWAVGGDLGLRMRALEFKTIRIF